MRRRPWLEVTAAIASLGCLIAAGLTGGWRRANRLPVYPMSPVVMPVPNGYDDCFAAGRLCRGLDRRPLQKVPVELPQLKALLIANCPALDRLRQGLAKPYLTPPMASLQPAPPEFGVYHQLVLLLLAEGSLAERQSQPAAAARRYLDCLRLGVNVTRGGDLSHASFGFQLQNLGLKALQDLTPQLDARTAATAAREMARLDAGAPSLADALAVQRDAITIRMAQAVQERDGWRRFAPAFTGPTAFEAVTPAQAAWARLQFGLMPKREILDGMRAYLAALIANAQQPYYARPRLPPPPRDRLSPWILPGPGWYEPVRRDRVIRDAWWRVTELRLAAQAWERQHRTPPPSLEALVPTYLPAVPRDPFAPKPMAFRRDGRRVQIYSRGPDGDNDSGLDLGAMVLPRFGRARPPDDGDLASLHGLSASGR